MIIVQLGANKGNDKLTEFVNNNHKIIDKLILVEPIPFHIEDLKNCYSHLGDKVIIENVAIKLPNNIDNEMILYYHVDDQPRYEVASFDYFHVFKHYGTSINTKTFEGLIKHIAVPTMTLNELLNKHEIRNLDWLLIDIEGLDGDVIETFDWGNYNIKRIDVEHIHWETNKRERIFNLLNKMNYKQVMANDTRYDIAFEK